MSTMTPQNHGTPNHGTAGEASTAPGTRDGHRGDGLSGDGLSSDPAPAYRTTLRKGWASGRPLRVYEIGSKAGWFFWTSCLLVLLLSPLALPLLYPFWWITWPLAAVGAGLMISWTWMLSRIFRVEGEPPEPRPRWKTTGTAASSRTIALVCAGCLAVDALWMAAEIAHHQIWMGPMRLFCGLVLLFVTIFWGRSWRRQTAGASDGAEGRRC